MPIITISNNKKPNNIASNAFFFEPLVNKYTKIPATGTGTKRPSSKIKDDHLLLGRNDRCPARPFANSNNTKDNSMIIQAIEKAMNPTRNTITFALIVFFFNAINI